jgi:hypothetical protein
METNMKTLPLIGPKAVIGPLFESVQFSDTKDPCPVFDGTTWHLFGSGGTTVEEVWQILHAVASTPFGPWKVLEPANLIGVAGDHVAAPSVFFEDGTFHMHVQIEFLDLGGSIEYLTSVDGHNFERKGTALESVPASNRAGIYDPHVTWWGGQYNLAYAGTPDVVRDGRRLIQPDVHLAVSNSSQGPWEYRGVILEHDHVVDHHNPRHHPTYEWGLEGPQIIPLPNGTFLLNATCFLPEGPFGTRQRVFFAWSHALHGPYQSLGPVLDPATYSGVSWLSGENGHAAGVVAGDSLLLYFQGRSHLPHSVWRYGLAKFDLATIYEAQASAPKKGCVNT